MFDLDKKLEKLMDSPAFKNELGKLIIRIIYVRTKQGFGVSSDEVDNPQKVRLKPLSRSYIEQRQGKAFYFRRGQYVIRVDKGNIRKPNLGSFASPARSNLTYTGQMLDSMKFSGIKFGVEVYIANNTRSDGLTNQDVADYVRKDRPFFALTVAEQRIVTQFIEDYIYKHIEST